MARMSSQEKLIREAERFAAGCSRNRLELRLVDEIHRLNAYIDKQRELINKLNDNVTTVLEELKNERNR